MTINPRDDLPQLVHQAQQGSHSAFTQLVEIHRNALLSYLLVRCGDRDRAEDITQHTLLKAWEHIGNVDNPAGFKTWMLTIARHRLYNDHRWRSKRRFISYEGLLSKIGDHLPRPFSSPDPNAGFADREQVRELLQQMPESLSEPLMLSRGFGLTSLEIAQIMELTPVAVRTRIHRSERMFHSLRNADETTKCYRCFTSSTTASSPRNAPN